MPEPESRPDLTAAPLELTVVKGLVDAVSHLALGHVFVANMTGNVVFLAFAVAGAARKLASIGAMLGGWWSDRSPPTRRRGLKPVR